MFLLTHLDLHQGGGWFVPTSLLLLWKDHCNATVVVIDIRVQKADDRYFANVDILSGG